jgi:GNAT superfamily N-acetyltransferase
MLEPTMASRLDFKELFLQENELLAKDPGSTGGKSDLRGRLLKTETPGPAGEPWIRYTPIDRVGLAFSGGGIRSATFNLGVLKALHELGLLKHVDYLSTVSGGGYIGAWWTAWRARWGKEFPEALPDPNAGKNSKPEEMNREPEEVRHLREFSNFLSPRIGFFQSEMWNAVMAVLSAVLPAVVVASSVIALAFLAWLGVNSLILASALGLPVPGRDWLIAHGLSSLTGQGLSALIAPAVLSVITIVTYISLEWTWHGSGKGERLSSMRGLIWVHLVMPVLIILGICLGWHYLITQASWMNPQPPPSGVSRWEWSTGISSGGPAFSFSPHLFDAPILWAGVAFVVFVPRLLIMRFRPVSVSGTAVSAIDRALSRMLGAAVVVAGLGVLWLAGCWLSYKSWGTKAVPAGGALLSGGAFTLLRNWIGRLGPAKKGGVMDIVKPLIPQILAYVAIALWAICIAALLAGQIEKGISPWLLFAIALGIVVFAVLVFDPAQVSMHSFYRSRLARAYLGASNLDAKKLSEQNRQTDVRLHDDIELRALSPTVAELAEDKKKPDDEHVYYHDDSSGRVRPLHLVCCAANDIGGDHLENLSRGSRSAVLSKLGFAIGNYWKRWETDRETLGLGSAITASAAAFNSNMGSLSMTLGAGVTFLCTALNLRLGLWLGHPLSDKIGAPKWTPGRLFLKEMFGLTNSGLRPSAATDQPKPVAKYVHLSDGAHFENLALYELVRRHCRYIIVSDCGADPEVAFDDFGNAVRRIREDFGVEIDVDLSPLKPNAARISKQHVAVGTISYDPRGDRKDNAILVYFKPALTGDEPCDITQYRTRNEDFPHESTGDQFYDEAQWESYRRLGEHATRSALHFVERERRSGELSADAIFDGARWEWYQSPERLDEKIVELTGRFTALEEQLREDAPTDFIREMYPELGTIGKKNDQDKADQSKTPVVPPKPEEIGQTLHFLIQIIQLMEDAWLACHLETHWNHPNNLGWMNAFQRWAYTPSFRLWWPILKPMYGRKFRRFMEERLSLADEDYPPTTATVTNQGKNLPSGVAQIYWKRMHQQDPEHGKDKTVYSYDLKLTQQSEEGQDIPYYVQAGLAFLDLSEKTLARWNVEDFFVPPSLWGAGLGAKFLNQLLARLKAEKLERCEVAVEAPKESDGAFEWLKRTDLASRQQLNDLLAFYQRANFTLDAKNRLVRDLKDFEREPALAPARTK